MVNRISHKAFLFVAASTVLFILSAAYLSMGKPHFSEDDPAHVLMHYIKALYARDFREAYRFISAQDKRLKDEKVYVRERGAFSGFTLQVARRLADFIEATAVEKKINENHATIKFQLKLPDAGKLSPHLFEWDEERLNSLSAREQRALIKKLDQWHKERKISTIEGDEGFDLVKEDKGWRLFLNWAAGVRVVFAALAPRSIAIEARPVQKEVLIQPGEPFTIAFRVKNRSHQEISTRIAHHVEPKAIAEYLDIVECGLLFPVKLSPGKEEEYSTTYMIRGDLPEGVRRLAVTYEFKIDEQ